MTKAIEGGNRWFSRYAYYYDLVRVLERSPSERTSCWNDVVGGFAFDSFAYYIFANGYYVKTGFPTLSGYRIDITASAVCFTLRSTVTADTIMKRYVRV